MRMRKKHNLDERILACSEVNLGWLQDYKSEKNGIETPQIITSQSVFGNDNPIYLEIGCGKGRFAQEIAEKNPDINFVAIEQTTNVIVTAMERTVAKKTPNLRYIMGMAEYLEKVFTAGTVDRIFLNFSCPYPKARYAKHRLTHERFLSIYRNILKDDGLIIQKTDNKGFFEFSLNSLCAGGFLLKNITFDLHNSDITGNIMTEYEEKFSSEGFPIYYLEAVNKKFF